MRFSVQCTGMVLGHSDLLERDASMGVAFGALRPAPEPASVQQVFRLCAEANSETSAHSTDEEKLARYYAARDALGLELLHAAGDRIATRTIQIADYSVKAGSDAIEVEVILEDARFFERYPSGD